VKLQLARMAYPVTSLGPGRRVALWVSGCGMRCRGCITPDLWDMAAGRTVEVDRVLQRILALDLPLDGITLSGGEPFDQPAPLGWLLRRVRAVRPDWSSLVFSGYPYPALKAGRADADALLSQIDILVAGPYDRRRPGVHPLAATANQTVHYLTERGEALRGNIDSGPANRVDLALGRAGEALLVGILAPDARSRIHEALVPSATRPAV
jgi:anaerobic ribonucleoside-triphosphate reductase activating protein